MMMGMSRIVHILCIVLFLYLFISLVEADALSQETDALKEQASSLLSVYTLPIITLTFIIGLQQAFWGQKTLVPTLFTVGFVLMAGTIFILTDCLFHAHGYYADWVLYVSTLIAVVAGCVGGLVSVCWIAWGAFQYGALLGAIIGLSIYSAFLSNIIPPDHPDLWLDATVLACLFLWGFLCVYYHTSMLLLTACLFGSYLMVRSALTAIGFTWPAPPNMQLLTTSSSSSSSTTTSITSKSLSTSDYLLLYISLGIIVIIALIGLWFQMSQPDRLPMHQRGPHSHIDYYTLNPKPGSGKMAQRRLNGRGGGVEHSNGHVIHSSTTYV